MLVGIGFDIHKHSENSDLYLAGLKLDGVGFEAHSDGDICLLYTSPSPRDATLSRMPSSA